MANARQIIFPYGMERNDDGSWTFFNRKYKTCGTNTADWSEWDDPRHRLYLKGLGPKKLQKLDVDGNGTGDRIYFYNDGTNPELSAKNMSAYLEKLKILINLSDDLSKR